MGKSNERNRIVWTLCLLMGMATTASFSQVMELKFSSLDGKKIDISSMKGKLVLVDCWATWCGPCLREMPHIKRIYDTYHAKGLEVIGISMDEESARGRAKSFLKKNNISWPQRFEGKGFDNDTFKNQYNLESLPTVFLLDKEGNIIDRDARGDRLEILIKKYMK